MMETIVAIVLVAFFFFALSLRLVFIKGGEFLMGADNDQAQEDEYPKHKVIVNSFWMDQTEVTNNQFKEFVDATGYITTAEKAIDWEEIKKILPPGTPKPNDSLLAPASLVFFECKTTDLLAVSYTHLTLPTILLV